MVLVFRQIALPKSISDIYDQYFPGYLDTELKITLK